MVCRYTDPDGNQYDAVIDVIEGDQAVIAFRPAGRIMSVVRWVDVSTLSVPR